MQKLGTKKAPVGTRARRVIELPVQKQGNSVDKELGGSIFISSFLE
jgi:hypothetical protein